MRVRLTTMGAAFYDDLTNHDDERGYDSARASLDAAPHLLIDRIEADDPIGWYTAPRPYPELARYGVLWTRLRNY